MTAAGSLDDVLVVIPCLNEERILPSLLDTLIPQSGNALIVVADGGSTDRSREIIADFAARFPNVRLMDNPQRLQSAGVNLAAQTYGGGHRWMVRVDAHCTYPDHYVAGLLEAAKAQDATSVVVPMTTRGSHCFQRAVAIAQNSVLGNGGSPHRTRGRGQFVDHGHHALFRLDLFTAVGGYDENFSHNEDAELDQRLLKAGARIWLEQSQAIVYYPRKTPLALYRQYRNYGAGRAQTMARHHTRLKLRQIIPIMIAPVVISALLGILLTPLHWLFALFAFPALVWAGACCLTGAVYVAQGKSRCAILSGPAAMIMHIGWSLGFLRLRIFGAPLPPPPPPLIVKPSA